MGNIVKISNVVANSIERISSVESPSIVNLEGSTFIQDMDNIIIGGTFSSANVTSVNRLCKINLDDSLDSTFGIGTGFNSQVQTIEIQTDGKILVGGSFTTYKGLTQTRIARLNTDGSLDSTFNIGNGFGSFGQVQTIVVQADGKILVGGSFTTYKGLTQNYIARLNIDGSLDSSFDIGTGFGSIVSSIAIQADGKIIIGGSFTTYNGSLRNRIIRLNVDGSLDSSFIVGTGFNNNVTAIKILTDGKILLVGGFTTYNGSTRNGIIRLNIDGSLDSSFIVGTGFDDLVYSIAVQSDGKILVVGSFLTYNGVSRNRIVRLNTDGSLDSTFVTGTGFNGPLFIVYYVAIQSDGKIIVGGNFTTYNGLTRNRIVRLETNGVADKSFISFNTESSDGNAGITIKILSDGKILVGGNFTEIYKTPVSRLLKINLDNSLDLNFNLEDEFNSLSTVFSQLRQTDGKFIMAGSFTTYNGLTQNRIIRFNTDGSLDSSFVIGTGFNADVNIMVLQTDGKIIIGGSFTTYKDLTQNRIIRLNTDGSLDSSFIVGTGFNNNVNALSIQSDGKILVGGAFTTYKDLTQNRIIRLNTDGSLDSSFVIGTGFNGTVNTLSTQSDGKILVGGVFTTYSGLTRLRIARLDENGSIDTSFIAACDSTVTGFAIRSDEKILICGNFSYANLLQLNRIAVINTDGSLDSSFNIGTGFNNTVHVTTQVDGKLLVGGDFTTYKGLTQNRIARLNADGSLDTSFVIGTGFSNIVFAIAVQGDGKILVGGAFTTYNGSTRNRIIRLNTDGSLDSTFDIGTGFNQSVRRIVIQSDGKIIILGDFSTYKGLTQNRIIRLNTDGSLDSTFVTGTGFDSLTYDMVLLSNGKILVGGAFATYNGSTRTYIARINTNGSLDSTFTPPSFISSVRSLFIQLDGKILVGGDFTALPGRSAYLERLNINGTVDSTFNIGSLLSSSVSSVFQQTDGKIIVSGSFLSTISRIIRLNINGSIDTDFLLFLNNPPFRIIQFNDKILMGGQFTNYSTSNERRIALLNSDGSVSIDFKSSSDYLSGFDSSTNSIMLQSNGKILVGGNFITYKGQSVNRIARINANGSLDTAFSISLNAGVNNILKY
jgi:uncharacterized delta-60 repeat protein